MRLNFLSVEPINVANVAHPVEERQMTVHSLKQVEQTKADGRWDRAYASGKDMPIPVDLLAALKAEPSAMKWLAKRNAQNRFAIAFRPHHMKPEPGRKRKVTDLVEMLKNGESIYPRTLK